MTRPGWVYILASRRNGTTYVGVTSNLPQRLYQHRQGSVAGFAKDKNCSILVWFERHEDIHDARQREWRMKKWKRSWKLELIEKDNPQWKDLTDRLAL
ncbi:GIY-YIG nuclease family protein [Novosphingopyxis sp.]|uniref:GIY-YIG nuclease family protein n=1 Tax=Novosphingopyxis sp. TaxID=2709690 RepID=UPI003B5BD8E4